MTPLRQVTADAGPSAHGFNSTEPAVAPPTSVYIVTLHTAGHSPLVFSPADVVAHIEDAFGNVGIDVTVECRPAPAKPRAVVGPE